jgi:steroid 5-alpha reductase family enzyme
VLLSLAMAGAWAVARRPGKEGWTDATWSFATGAAGVIGALLPLGEGPGHRQWLVAGMAAAWGLRLGTHITARSLKDAEDPRYVALKKEWGAAADRKLFLFLQVQALCGWVLAMSVTIAAHSPAPFPAWSDAAGALLFGGALLGETVADRQMAAFRANPANKGKIADTGLWGRSRHPNYFFEWLGWWSYPLIAVGPGAGWAWGWAALAAPAMMYGLLVHASGIPPLEKAMLESRGEAFRAYQRRVRAFFPLPK